MPRRVLDTNVLIGHWALFLQSEQHRQTADAVRRWAKRLIDLHGSDAILSPIYIEFVAGMRNEREARLARAYLGEFDVVDEGRILPRDWEKARELAERVPRDGLRRQLGDCLIRAICLRLKYDVFTHERRFVL